MFHRAIQEIKISASLLYRTYKKFGVKFKFIHRGKKVIDYTNQYYNNLFREMYEAVKVTRLQDVLGLVHLQVVHQDGELLPEELGREHLHELDELHRGDGLGMNNPKTPKPLYLPMI